MAQRHTEITDAGAVVAGISVDAEGRNAAMVAKLRLPFPLLADPGGTAAIKPLGLWHDEPSIARPAVLVVAPDGEESFRWVSRDFADRITEDAVVGQVRSLGLDPVTQPAPAPGILAPGARAMPVAALGPYFRGVRFAALAIGGRVPEAAAETDALTAEADRYAEAIKTLG